MSETIEVNFFVLNELSKAEHPLMMVEMPFPPVVGQHIYLSHIIDGKGLTRTKYKVVRCDWSFMRFNYEKPTNQLEVILKVIKSGK